MNARIGWLFVRVAYAGEGESSQVIFQLSTSSSYAEIYQLGSWTPKTGCDMVIEASDGNLWVAAPVQEAVYSTPVEER